MKRFVFVASCFALSAGLAAAQNCKGTAILQAQAALGSTKEGKAADEDLNARLGPKAAALKTRDEEVKSILDKINRGGNTMSDAAKATLQKEYDSKNKSLTRDKQDFEDEANAETNKVLADLSDKLKKVIDQYRKENNLCLVVNVSDPNTPIVSFSDEIDITSQIIAAYDKAAASAPAKTASPAKAAPAPAKPTAGPATSPAKPVPAPGK